MSCTTCNGSRRVAVTDSDPRAARGVGAEQCPSCAVSRAAFIVKHAGWKSALAKAQADDPTITAEQFAEWYREDIDKTIAIVAKRNLAGETS